MKFISALIFMMFLTISGFGKDYVCLPPDVKQDTVVSVVTTASPQGAQVNTAVTVKQTLKKLKARCSHAKLLDRKGKQIRFYNLQGCWGNPPADYLEIMEKQRTELDALKKKYTVIELTCNPSGIPLP